MSVLVIQEASAGDKNAAQRRLEALENIPEIHITEEVEIFANVLLEKVPLPQKAWFDALHIAAATIGGMDYLLTWNCTHIANATFRPKIEALCRAFSYEPPII